MFFQPMAFIHHAEVNEDGTAPTSTGARRSSTKKTHEGMFKPPGYRDAGAGGPRLADVMGRYRRFRWTGTVTLAGSNSGRALA